ncbi:MAG TPA: VOC family protein [Acidothermaceae bacterium]|nr:VOC family protein [Acidothermaceae bacterium]
MSNPTGFPALRSVVLDTTDARGLAEFYRALLGYEYRPGDEPPADGEPDPNGSDWLVLLAPGGTGRIAFQQVDRVDASTWPDPAIPQQLHLDLSVPTDDELAAQHERIVALGAKVLLDRSDDPEEALYVYADLAGHPFCVFVASES